MILASHLSSAKIQESNPDLGTNSSTEAETTANLLVLILSFPILALANQRQQTKKSNGAQLTETGKMDLPVPTVAQDRWYLRD